MALITSGLWSIRFDRAARQGYAEAQCWLADCLSEGRGTADRKPDLPAALPLYRAAGLQGMPEAQYQLGMLTVAAAAADRSAARQSRQQAEAQQAAADGPPPGANAAPGEPAAGGGGGFGWDSEVREHEAEAVRWFEAAARQGHGKVSHGLQLQCPMESPCCSCKLTRGRARPTGAEPAGLGVRFGQRLPERPRRGAAVVAAGP